MKISENIDSLWENQGKTGSRTGPKPVKTSENRWVGWWAGYPPDHGCWVDKGDYVPPPTTTQPPQQHRLRGLRVHRSLPGVRRCSPGFFRLGPERHLAELILDPKFGVVKTTDSEKTYMQGYGESQLIVLELKHVFSRVFTCFHSFLATLLNPFAVLAPHGVYGFAKATSC